MKIIIELDELESKDITIEQYYFLACLHLNKLGALIRYTERYGEFKHSMIEDLKRKDFLDYSGFTGSLTDLRITDKGKSFIDSMKVENQTVQASIKEEQFDELLAVYPKKTDNGRRLQSNVVVDRDKLIKKYFINLVKTKCTHEQVIQSVKNEIKTRSTNGSNAYFSMLSTYINQGQWIGYLGPDTKKNIYGGDFK